VAACGLPTASDGDPGKDHRWLFKRAAARSEQMGYQTLSLQNQLGMSRLSRVWFASP